MEAAIIVAIVVLSVILNFYQVFQAQRAVEDLRQQVASTATVIRDGTDREVPVTATRPRRRRQAHGGQPRPRRRAADR